MSSNNTKCAKSSFKFTNKKQKQPNGNRLFLFDGKL